MKFRLVTYNMHKGIGGVDRRYRPNRVIEVIEHCQPDVVLLQEVDADVPRSNRDLQVDVLADALGFQHRAFHPNVTLRRGHYGNAIVSRYPLTDVQNVDLSVRLKKRRGALVAQVNLRGDGHARTVHLLNVHLGLAGFERSIQVRRLLRSDPLAGVHVNTAVIAAGDFNDPWCSLGKRLLRPAGFELVSGRTKTFPAIRPLRSLDRVYTRGKLKLLHCFASRTRIARRASDHLPLVVDLEVLA